MNTKLWEADGPLQMKIKPHKQENLIIGYFVSYQHVTLWQTNKYPTKLTTSMSAYVVKSREWFIGSMSVKVMILSFYFKLLQGNETFLFHFHFACGLLEIQTMVNV